MHTKTRTLVLAAALAALGAALPARAAAKAETAFLLKDVIIVKADVEKSDALFSTHKAADDLVAIVSNMTGRVPAVYPLGRKPKDSSAPVIYLGGSPAATAAGVTGEGLRLGDWRVKCEKNAAYLFGRSGYAVCAAVFDFAEKALDYHVLFPDDGPDAFTPDENAAVPVMDRTVKPAVYNREIYSARFDHGRFPYMMKFWERYGRARSCEPGFSRIEAKYRISGQTKHCHSSFDYLPPEKYFKDHPEYYSMGRDGKRKGVRNAQCQLCYTNPDTYRLVLESLLGFIEADRRKFPDDPPLVYDFTQMDNSDFICLCPECKKVIAKYNRVEGGHKEGGDAGLVLEFANRLARDVRERYPDVQVRIFAYVSTERAPEKGKIELEPNLRIWWCNVYSRCDATIPLLTKGHFNEGNAREIKEWTELTKNVEIWDYLYCGDHPCPATDAIASNIRYFVSLGIDSIFMEDEYWSGVGSWDELRRYVLAKLYIEPDLDVDQLVKTFCRAYGKGADEMYAAYRYLREVVLTRYSKDHFEQRTGINTWKFDPEVMLKFGAFVKRAYDKEPGEKYRARLVPFLERASKKLIDIYRRDPKAKDKFAQAIKTYRRWAIESGYTRFSEPKWRKDIEKGVDETIDLLTLKFDDIPDELKAVPEEDLVFCDTRNAWGGGKRVDDPLSPRGRASFKKTSSNFVCGVYDRPSKESYGQRVVKCNEELSADKYTWVKLKTFHLGLETIFWFDGSWANDFNFKDHHILADGMDVDPNWYELWISARYADGAIYIDRLVLRRIAPPKGRR
ncbi:MAG: DUF4838 domain-containing protein [Kiritimatiellae bacterium]|nr:DUF4838 domain-containing protein [Kiritimatiellia bacterium]